MQGQGPRSLVLPENTGLLRESLIQRQRGLEMGMH